MSNLSRSDVITLVDDLSLSVTNSTEVGVLYDEIVRELGFAEVLTSTEVHNIDAGQSVLEFEMDTIRSLEMYSSQVGRLDKASEVAVRAVYGNGWRGMKGVTRAYVQDQQDESSVRLVPIPSAPFTITVIRVDRRLDVPHWLELPLSLEILSREMMRESDHQDMKLAMSSTKLGRLIFALLGVNVAQKEM